jgi:hypothetical protein
VEKYLALRHKQQNKNHILLTSHRNYQTSSKNEAAIKLEKVFYFSRFA